MLNYFVKFDHGKREKMGGALIVPLLLTSLLFLIVSCKHPWKRAGNFEEALITDICIQPILWFTRF